MQIQSVAITNDFHGTCIAIPLIHFPTTVSLNIQSLPGVSTGPSRRFHLGKPSFLLMSFLSYFENRLIFTFTEKLSKSFASIT